MVSTKAGAASSTKKDCTPELRRELRKEQRGMLKEIEEGTIGTGSEQAEQDDGRLRNNTLLKQVRHTRELKIDADIFHARTKMALKQVEARFKPVHYDANKLVTALNRKCGSKDANGRRTFDWKTLGNLAGVCFNSVPSKVVFMSGPMASEADLEPAKKKRRFYHHSSQNADDSVEEVMVAEETAGQAQASSPSQESMFVSEVQQMKKALKAQGEAARRAGTAMIQDGGDDSGDTNTFDNEIDMVPFLVNPKSYTQTIENFMNVSHLVKQGTAGVRKGQDGMMYIRAISKRHRDSQVHYSGGGTDRPETNAPRQAILSLTMRDWRALIKAYKLTEGGLPHRVYGQTTTRTTTDDNSCASRAPHRGTSEEEQQLRPTGLIASGRSSSGDEEKEEGKDGSTDIPAVTQESDME